jgi:hypothetical protein
MQAICRPPDPFGRCLAPLHRRRGAGTRSRLFRCQRARAQLAPAARTNQEHRADDPGRSHVTIGWARREEMLPPLLAEEGRRTSKSGSPGRRSGGIASRDGAEQGRKAGLQDVPAGEPACSRPCRRARPRPVPARSAGENDVSANMGHKPVAHASLVPRPSPFVRRRSVVNGPRRGPSGRPRRVWSGPAAGSWIFPSSSPSATKPRTSPR